MYVCMYMYVCMHASYCSAIYRLDQKASPMPEEDGRENFLKGIQRNTPRDRARAQLGESYKMDYYW